LPSLLIESIRGTGLVTTLLLYTLGADFNAFAKASAQLKPPIETELASCE
jgi:hypothetical protein